MSTVERSTIVSPFSPNRFARTRVDDRNFASEAIETDRRRDGWRKILDVLGDWLSDPSSVEDDGITAPTKPLIQRSMRFVDWCMGQDVSPPMRVVPSPDGGVVFEWWRGSSVRYIEIDPTGATEEVEYVRGRLVTQQSIDWP